jgi:hypothetical protein
VFNLFRKKNISVLTQIKFVFKDGCYKSKSSWFFLVKRVLCRGPEQREPNEAVLCPLIILILVCYYYILLLNY